MLPDTRHLGHIICQKHITYMCYGEQLDKPQLKDVLQNKPVFFKKMSIMKNNERLKDCSRLKDQRNDN